MLTRFITDLGLQMSVPPVQSRPVPPGTDVLHPTVKAQKLFYNSCTCDPAKRFVHGIRTLPSAPEAQVGGLPGSTKRIRTACRAPNPTDSPPIGCPRTWRWPGSTTSRLTGHLPGGSLRDALTRGTIDRGSRSWWIPERFRPMDQAQVAPRRSDFGSVCVGAPRILGEPSSALAGIVEPTKGVTMFARTSTWSGSPEALQKWADNAEQVKGFVEGLPGNAGVVFLVDRAGGTALTLTLWDSETPRRPATSSRTRAATRRSPRPAPSWWLAAATKWWARARVLGRRRGSHAQPRLPSTISPPRSPVPAGRGWTSTRCAARCCRSSARPFRSTRCGGLPRTRPRCCSPRATARSFPSSPGTISSTNEFLHRDVNKWTELARDPIGVRTLMEATDGHPARSDRYRDIFAPLGLEDELRAVLRMRGDCWGYVCLHRESAVATFTRDEARFVRRIAPHLAEGIRMGCCGRPATWSHRTRVRVWSCWRRTASSPGRTRPPPDGSPRSAAARTGRTCRWRSAALALQASSSSTPPSRPYRG